MLRSAAAPRALLAFALLPSLAAAGACGDDGTGPSGPGSMSAVLVDSPVDGGGSGLAGTFEADVVVQVSTDGSAWEDVGDASSVVVGLQADEPVSVGREVEVPAGDYRHLRVRISGAAAELDAGSVVGGEPLDEPADIEVADGEEIVVEREVFSFRVDAETAMSVVVDVRSDDWVTAGVAADGSVSPEAFRSAVVVETRRS